MYVNHPKLLRGYMDYLQRFLLLALFPFFVFAQNHLLVSEFVVSPTAGEFIEIYNPTGSTIPGSSGAGNGNNG